MHSPLYLTTTGNKFTKMCLAHKKTSLPRKVEANGHFTAWKITSIILETNSQRCVWLTKKPHFQKKLEQTDISLPGQLFQLRKIDHHYGLINIVIFYYNWKRIYKDMSGSQENLTSKKSWSKRTFHCLDNY